MPAPPPTDVIRRANPSAPAELRLAAEGVQRWIWEGRFGAMLIEVAGGVAYVIGQPVRPFDRTACRSPQPGDHAASNGA